MSLSLSLSLSVVADDVAAGGESETGACVRERAASAASFDRPALVLLSSGVEELAVVGYRLLRLGNDWCDGDEVNFVVLEGEISTGKGDTPPFSRGMSGYAVVGAGFNLYSKGWEI
jgi:hypothetical protein